MLSRTLISVGALLIGAGAQAADRPVDSKLFSGLVWRNIGPFRGGRVAAVTGVVGDAGTFYMGLPNGGVWKTTSAGQTWFPIFDSVKEASSVGSIEVAPSNPNVIYVGMGDMVTGGGINEGNGVYKSTDAGKTWVHMGLEETRQIPSMLVDPHNPDLVLLAAQGNIHQESDDRGVFRSTDGGKTWKRTLFVDKQTGAQKITWAVDHPEVMLATTVRHYSAPGGAGGRGGGGGFGGGQGISSTKLFKSTDQGQTWTELKEGGLPSLSGRTCVAIAKGTNGQRMFLVGNFGLYRSDDGGTNWRRMDEQDRRIMNGQGGYNCGVYVNPDDPDTVYVINTCSYVSHDGGKTFTGFKGAPGGDDPQQMWIDPTNGKRIFLGMDQGATISLDAGGTWSSWYNQPSAQVYHIAVDNQYPYWVYATEQDSGAIATRSRGDLGAITPLDWLPTPGYEFGSVAPDPRDPKTIYCGGPGGGIVKITYPSGQWVNVSPNLESGARLRKVGNQPIIFSPTNSRELFAGFNFLMSTTDGGQHWHKLGIDLGYPKGVKPPEENAAPNRRKPNQAAAKPPIGGNVEMDEDDDDEEAQEASLNQQGPAFGGAIESISPSPLKDGLIWVGTNNGLVKLTQDHGKTWEDVSISGLPTAGRGDVEGIEASHSDPAEAYAAVDFHTSGDYKPYFFRTRDYGKTWTRIVRGLPTDERSGSFARVIRSDTKRSGLLFAGTEASVYVSFNDGDDWQPLTLNLPNTSYRDMVVKDNDLVVGTYGRGFWVLDDISPLREVSSSLMGETAHLFKPGEAIRVRRNINADTPFPPEVPHALNPPVGAILYYYLGSEPQGEVNIEVSDASGRVVRHMTSAPIPPSNEPAAPVPDFWLEIPQPLEKTPGMYRVNWDLRYDAPPAFSHSYEINANPGQTPASPQGPLALPGVYTVTLTVNGKKYSQTVKVRNDPRSPARVADLRAQAALQMKLYDEVRQAWNSYQQVAALRASLSDVLKQNPGDEVEKACSDLDSKLSSIGGSSGGRRFGGGFPGAGGPPPAPTFSGTHGALLRQLDTLDSGDMAPTEPMLRSYAAAEKDLLTVTKNLEAVKSKELVACNAVLAKHGLKALTVDTRVASTGTTMRGR